MYKERKPRTCLPRNEIWMINQVLFENASAQVVFDNEKINAKMESHLEKNGGSFFLAVPWQLNRWPCHWLLTSLPTYLPPSLPTYSALLKNTTIEHSERFVTFETFDQSDEETWPDQQKDNDKDNDNDNDNDIWRTPSKSDSGDLWPFRHLIRRHDYDNDHDI